MISIIIPVYNRREGLRTTLESISRSDYEDYEVIVVDGGSNDGTVKVAESYSKVSIVFDDGETSYSARNEGVEASEGDKILFLDADVSIEENLLNVVEKEVEPGVVAGFPIDIVSEQKNIFTVYSTRHLPVKRFIEQDGFIPTACLAVDSKVFKEDKCFFDEGLVSGGDRDFCRRLTDKGYELKLCSSKVYHPAISQASEMFSRWFRIGTWYASEGESFRCPTEKPKDMDVWPELGFEQRISVRVLYLLNCLTRIVSYFWVKFKKIR